MQPHIFVEASKIWKELSGENVIAGLQLELDVHKKMLNIFQVGDYYYMIFNVRETVFEFVSPEIEKVLGYDPAQVTVPFFIGSIHPDDQPWFLNFENKVQQFFATLTTDQVLNYKVRYDYRIRRKDGSYIRLLQQVVTIQFDGDNNVARTLVVHTDITHIKSEGLPLLSFIGMNGEPSYVNVDVQKVFTPTLPLLSVREREIVLHLIEGNNSKTIADKLYITKQTVDTHRKNILRKTNTRNTAALVSVAVKNGWV